MRTLRQLTACGIVALTLPIDAAEFPDELVRFRPSSQNPLFIARGSGHWDARIRERGWILRDGDQYKLWFTGYDDTRGGQKMLGLAVSRDGIHWQRTQDAPIYRDHWVEDMMVIKRAGTYYMFAEGRGDRAYLLTSADGVKWRHQGDLDVRLVDGQPIPEGPYGTPTAWFEQGTWYLFYERRDAGVWLASSRDLKVWKNVSDSPVLSPGPHEYDRRWIALNQIYKHDGRYYALYHGAGDGHDPRLWSTAIASSSDLIRWTKYAHNPLLPTSENRSSGIFVHDGKRVRLYTMHDRVDVHFAEQAKTPQVPQ